MNIVIRGIIEDLFEIEYSKKHHCLMATHLKRDVVVMAIQFVLLILGVIACIAAI